MPFGQAHSRGWHDGDNQGAGAVTCSGSHMAGVLQDPIKRHSMCIREINLVPPIMGGSKEEMQVNAVMRSGKLCVVVVPNCSKIPRRCCWHHNPSGSCRRGRRPYWLLAADTSSVFSFRCRPRCGSRRSRAHPQSGWPRADRTSSEWSAGRRCRHPPGHCRRYRARA